MLRSTTRRSSTYSLTIRPTRKTRVATSGAPRNGIPQATSSRLLPRSTSTWRNLASLASSSSTDILLVKRKALSLKNDPDTGGKYVSGLKIVRVRTTEDAKRVFRTGNINRRVFGTLANAASSRSHGIFTINVVRVHKADQSDVTVVASLCRGPRRLRTF